MPASPRPRVATSRRTPPAPRGPLASNLNLTANQTAAVLVVAKLSSTGQLTLYSSGGPTNVVLDVRAGSAAPADYTPLNPSRLLDSRATTSASYGVDYQLQVSGKGGVPASAGAVVLNVTSVDPTITGYVTMHPGGSEVPARRTSTRPQAGHPKPCHSATLVDRHGVDLQPRPGAASWSTSRAGSRPTRRWAAQRRSPRRRADPVLRLHARGGGRPGAAHLDRQRRRAARRPGHVGVDRRGHRHADRGRLGHASRSRSPTAATRRPRPSVKFTVYPFASQQVWGWGARAPASWAPARPPQRVARRPGERHQRLHPGRDRRDDGLRHRE